MTKFAVYATLLAAVASRMPIAEARTARGLAEGPGAEWTYRRTATDGEEPYGPSDWAEGYPDCSGSSQSPINLSAAVTKKFVKPSKFKLEFNSKSCMVEDLMYISNEAVWQVDFSGCHEPPSLSFDKDHYDLLQIHIHSPSEHMIGGSEHDAEIHFVHLREGSDADLLVVGVFLDASEYGSNIEISHLWNVLDMGESMTDSAEETSIYEIIPSSPYYSHYMGSLTTPPCTEGVKWIVMNQPITMSKHQLDEFRISVATFDDSKVDEMGNTNRPVQPLNDRKTFFVS